MTRHLTAFATAAALAIAVSAAAQAPAHRAHRRAQPAPAATPVTLTGCIAAGQQPNGFALTVISNDTSAGTNTAQPSNPSATGTSGTMPAAAAAISPGSQVELMGGSTLSLDQFVGRKVQVSGVLVPQGAARSHSTEAAAPVRLQVRRVERIANSCDEGAPAGTTGVSSSAPTSAPAPTPAPTPTRNATPTPNPTPAHPEAPQPTPTPSSTSSAKTSDALVSGLVNIDVQQVLANVSAENVANASDAIGSEQIGALIQAVNDNAPALKNAQELTTALRSKGLLQPNERVVGVSGSTIYKAAQP